MGILDNLEAYLENTEGKDKNTESAWDEEFSFESKPIAETDAMGREVFWNDLGRPDISGELKMASSCECEGCNCSNPNY